MKRALTDYDPSKDHTEAAAGRERALLQSIRKWRHMSSVPGKDLQQAWADAGCCLCNRYRGRCQQRKVCPLSLVNQDCPVDGSLWRQALNAYYAWEREGSLGRLRAFKYRARSVLWWLGEAYHQLYGEL